MVSKQDSQEGNLRVSNVQTKPMLLITKLKMIRKTEMLYLDIVKNKNVTYVIRFHQCKHN